FAAAVRAGAARAFTQLPALDAQGIGELERLDRRDERVRHRDVDGRRPVGVSARALAAADRLVVREAVAAEGDVVHRALPLRAIADRAEEHVDDAGRGLGVAGDDGRRRTRVYEAAF